MKRHEYLVVNPKAHRAVVKPGFETFSEAYAFARHIPGAYIQALLNDMGYVVIWVNE